MTQHFRQFNGFIGVDNLRLPPAVIPAQAGIQKFDVAAILKHSCNIKDWITACAGMTAFCVLFEYYLIGRLKKVGRILVSDSFV